MINTAFLDAELRNRQVRSVLTDFADCYDRLRFDYQRQVWARRRLPQHIQRLLDSLVCRNMTTSLSLDGRLSSIIEKQRGVPQDSILRYS